MTDIKDNFTGEDIEAFTKAAVERINSGNPLVLLLATSPKARLEHQKVLDGMVLEEAMRNKEPSDFGGRLFARDNDYVFSHNYYMSVDPRRFKKIWDFTHWGRTNSKLTLNKYGFEFMEKKTIPLALKKAQQKNADLVQVGFSACPCYPDDSSTRYFEEIILYQMKNKNNSAVKNKWNDIVKASKIKVKPNIDLGWYLLNNNAT